MSLERDGDFFLVVKVGRMKPMPKGVKTISRVRYHYEHSIHTRKEMNWANNKAKRPVLMLIGHADKPYCSNLHGAKREKNETKVLYVQRENCKGSKGSCNVGSTRKKKCAEKNHCTTYVVVSA